MKRVEIAFQLASLAGFFTACSEIPSTPTPSTPDQPEPVLPDFHPSEPQLHRLTAREYRNTVRDLLGPVEVTTDLEVDTPLFGFSTIGAASLTITPRAAEQYQASARALTAQVFGDSARRAQILGCQPIADRDPCLRTFVERFGRRVFRRPLAAEEVDRYYRVYEVALENGNEMWASLGYVAEALLLSPYFLFRVDRGVDDPGDPTRLRYSGYEIAARLSYFLWSSTPDDTLLEAAARGALDDAAGIEAEARRMLDDPRAREALLGFFDEYFKLDRLNGISKDAALFPQANPELYRSMRQEIRLLIDDIVFEHDRDVRAILDSDHTFVDASLARLYGLPEPLNAGFSAVSLPADGPRAGILTTAGFLSLNAHAAATSPTRRGRFVRESILCEEISPPPAGVNTTLPPSDPSTGPETLRQRLEGLHVAAESCAQCHRRMDPLGFAFEGFDALGIHRDTDNGLPVDTHGELDGAAFSDAKSLALILRERPEISDCISRTTYRYAVGHLEMDSEARPLKQMHETFAASGHSFRALAVALVTSDGFRYAARPEE